MDDDVFERMILSRWTERIDRHFYAKLVGVSFSNSDGSSRQFAIRNLTQGEELVLHPDTGNEYDENAILVRNWKGVGLSHLERRLAGQVTRRLRKGFEWHSYLRRTLQSPGSHWGAVVCMVRMTIESKSGAAASNVLKNITNTQSATADKVRDAIPVVHVQQARRSWWSRLFSK